ncbi:H-NS histone family protein [Ramlibacter terrae]|uniref:H-NS histone family protein n=1 Tax=Ramlibacter terrae TaxID=2732511 RepID=A0ABX6P1X6_9BURK|nr:H-NS histone family protein [Ramlibacter terrae]
MKEQAEKLLAEAEKMREKEIADTISDIKEKIRAYGLTAEDTGWRAAPPCAAFAPRALLRPPVPRPQW